MGTLLLLRCGPLEPRWAGRVVGQTNAELARSARDAERSALTHVSHWHPVRILCSDLKRCRMTAHLFGEVLELDVAKRRALRERSYGEWEGLVWAELVADQESAVAFLGNFVRGEPPGGESLVQVQRRVVRVVMSEFRRHQRKTLLLVADAGPIRAVIGYALGMELEQVQRLELAPFSLSVLDLKGEASTLRLMGMELGSARP